MTFTQAMSRFYAEIFHSTTIKINYKFHKQTMKINKNLFNMMLVTRNLYEMVIKRYYILLCMT